MIKNKYLLFLVFLFLFLFLSGSFALALEVQYPSIPGLPNINQNNPGISEYVGYFFGLGVYVAGILSLISFTIGAVGLIASADNPETASNAKDRMKGAVLGLVLTVASFMIIRTINPTLITPTLTPLPGVAGVFYTNGSQQKPCPESNSDTSTIPAGFKNIQYVCSGNGPALLVWMFPNTGLETGSGNISGATVQRVTCNNKVAISGGSFKMAFETPGIYYYLGQGCGGYSSYANTGDNDNIASPFNGNIKSVRIVNDPASDIQYGVIFHKEIGLENGGMCADPIISDGCQPVGISASAADIFELNKNPGASGDGVSFYSEPYGWDTGANAGFYLMPDSGIVSPYFLGADAMQFSYTNVDRPDEYQNECKTFQDCPGSIKIKGSYLVALYDESLLYCQTFNANVENLNDEQIIAAGSTNLGDIYMIPTK